MGKFILTICEEIARVGGKPYFVGGYVRDFVMGLSSKDLDVEVYGLSLQKLEEILSKFGVVDRIGKSFGVLKVHGVNADFSIPRRDSRVGTGHKGFDISVNQEMDVMDAARRRDLTINALVMEPFTGEIIDMFGGLKDIEKRVLRATDPVLFKDDPLRVLRVAQFAARFDMLPDEQLIHLCSTMDLTELPKERVFEEFKKIALKSKVPSRAFCFLKDCDAINCFPELNSLIGCHQEPDWHPEGDVWVHTLMCLDEMVELRFNNERDNLVLFFAVLCHDLGKPLVTRIEDGRTRSIGHDEAAENSIRSFLAKITNENDLVEQVIMLVRSHLAPVYFATNHASPKAYRRLARKLAKVNLSLEMLERVARCDHFGRTTPDALARRFPYGDAFLENAKTLKVSEKSEPDVVMGRHLIALGMKPGPEFGKFLAKCRDIQDETGLKDPHEILKIAEIIK